MEYNIKYIANVLPNKIEQIILKLIDKNSPQCYAKLSKDEIISLEKNILQNLLKNKF